MDKNIKLFIFIVLVFVVCMNRKPPIKLDVKKGGFDIRGGNIFERTSFPPSRTF